MKKPWEKPAFVTISSAEAAARIERNAPGPSGDRHPLPTAEEFQAALRRYFEALDAFNENSVDGLPAPAMLCAAYEKAEMALREMVDE